MKSIALSINGRKVTCRSGETILDAAEQNGITIPTLCHHPHLKPQGACRICLVEDEKNGRLLASCVTPAGRDMAVSTHSSNVLTHRRNILRLMMAEHPESCIVCSKGNRCELRSVAAGLGVAEADLYPMPNVTPFEAANPFIVRDLGKCILCGRCIRADHDLVVTGAIEYNGRGFSSRPATLHGTPLEESSCTFCGTCVSMCPTGALSPGDQRFTGTPEYESDSICGFCGAGCRLCFGVSGSRIVETGPSRLNETVNGPTLCVRGHFAHDFLNTPDRLDKPMIRVLDEAGGTGLKAVSWDEAMDYIVTKLVEIKRRFGPSSLAFMGSSKCTNEENYLFQKIARVLFETNNVTNGGAWNGQALIKRIEEKSKGACRVSPLSGLENAEAIIAINADPDHSCPVAAYHIKRAFRRGTPIIIIDERKTGLTQFASVWLRPDREMRRASAPEMLNRMAARLIHQHAHDSDFVGRISEGFQEYKVSLADTCMMDSVKNGRAPQQESLEKAVEHIRGKRIAFVLGKDLLERDSGEITVDAAFNLALLTGSINAARAGFFIPGGENNLIGALDMGTLPDLLPGRRPLADAMERKSLEKAWAKGIPMDPGPDPAGLVEALEKGRIRALYVMGENILRSLPGRERITAALQKLDVLVVQDIVHNRTVDLADVILPAAAFAEKAGSFTNMEGRIQTFKPVVRPPGDAFPDWKILGLLARRMGYPEQYTTVEEIRQEIRSVIPMYAALGSHSREWVRNAVPDTHSGRDGSRFSFTPAVRAEEIPLDAQAPFMAFITTTRWHLGGGTRTDRSRRIKSMGQRGAVMLSPSECEAFDLGPEDKIRVSSAQGSIERAFHVDPGLPPGHLVIPQGFYGNDAVQLVDLDGMKKAASGWRSCRVNIEKI